MQVKEAVAACLTQADGQFCSGAVLAKKLGVSRNAVWKAVQALQNEGFPIEARKKTGYRITQEADLLTADSVRPYLHTRVLGHPLYVHPELDSTNARCRDLARRGAAHGTVVAANSQTAGRGRQGRLFCSPPGSGLYFSVLLKQAVALQEAPMLTACAAVAAARAIDALYSTHTQIKWVNDLYLDGKKCCGILTEGEVSLESGKLECAIIGIGINVRNTQSSLPRSCTPLSPLWRRPFPAVRCAAQSCWPPCCMNWKSCCRSFPSGGSSRNTGTAPASSEKPRRSPWKTVPGKRWLWWKSQTTAALWYGIPTAMWKLSTPEKCISVPAI